MDFYFGYMLGVATARQVTSSMSAVSSAELGF
jgi:hypothetical protein